MFVELYTTRTFLMARTRFFFELEFDLANFDNS